jgi:hypothetical protein
VWIAVGALAIAGVIVWILVRPARDSETTSSVAPAPGSSQAANAPGAPTPAPALPAGVPLPPPAPLGETNESLLHYPVDLDELRAKLPGNRYWELGAPTKDPEVKRAREEYEKRRNEQFGRTQSGEATEPEIRAYYAERKRVSEDFLQLALTVLAEKGDQLPERDRGIFELSAKLHQERLKQIERDLADALERRRARNP